MLAILLLLLLLLLLEQSVCHVLIGPVQAVHLGERVVREGIELGCSALASLRYVQWSVQAALDEVYLVCSLLSNRSKAPIL